MPAASLPEVPDGPDPGFDPQRSESVALRDAHEFESGHFEEREERRDGFLAVAGARHQGLEVRPDLPREHLGNLRDALGDGDPLDVDVVGRSEPALGDQPAEGLGKAEDVLIREFLLVFGIRRPVDARRAEEDVAAGAGMLIECARDLLVSLVFEQAADEFLAGVEGLVRVVGVEGRTRQEQGALDLHERRRHDQELARRLDGEPTHLFEIPEIRRSQASDRNVEDVELLFANQVQEEFERPVERRQFDRERLALEDDRHVLERVHRRPATCRSQT